MLKKRLLTSTTVLSVGVLGLLGVTSKAEAAIIFSVGDQISFSVGLQLNAADQNLGAGQPALGSNDTSYGANDSFIDFLFYQTAGGFGAPSLTVNNRVLNQSAAPGDDVVPGDVTSAIAGSSQGGNGAFASIAFGTNGFVTSFDENPTLGGSFIPNSFATPFLSTIDSNNVQFLYTLDFVVPGVLDEVIPGTFDLNFQGFGRVRAIDQFGMFMGEAPTIITFASTGIRDNGTGGDPVAGDNVTNAFPIVLNITVTSQVPEPTSTISLLAVGGLGLVSLKRKNRKNM